MDFILVFKFILENFQRREIKFALIGGFALQAVGMVRTTRDIDLLILSKDKNKVEDIMLNAGYKVLHESEDVLNFCSDKIELGRVDFLISHRKYTKAMLERAQIKEVLEGKFNIRVLAIEDQIGLKVQSSSNDPKRLHQDMADIEALIKNNYPNIDTGLLTEYFELFGRRKELDKILEEIKNVKQ